MIWNTEIETADRAKLNNIQSERLLTLIRRVYNNNDFYREKFKKARVKPSDIKSIEDIVKLPFTSKVEMINGYPYGLLSVDKKYVVEIHSSSGTTTKPVSSCYTANDIELWSEVMARSLTACGVTAKDTIQNAYGYGLFTGGFGFHYGARKIGANLIPVSGGNTKRQLMIMQDFGTDILLSLIHISEPTRLLSISYAVFCLKKKKKKNITQQHSQDQHTTRTKQHIKPIII